MLYCLRHGGAVAQLGEHLLCKQGVAGSIPVRSMDSKKRPDSDSCCRAFLSCRVTRDHERATTVPCSHETRLPTAGTGRERQGTVIARTAGAPRSRDTGVATPVHVTRAHDGSCGSVHGPPIAPAVLQPPELRSPRDRPVPVRLEAEEREPITRRRLAVPRDHAECRSRQLLLACWGIMVLAPTFPALFPTASPEPATFPQDVVDLAAFFWLLCLLPALHYVAQPARGRRPFPFMPLIGFLFGLYYPLVVLGGADNLVHLAEKGIGRLDPEHDYARPLRIALDGWMALYVTYLLTMRLPLPRTRRVGRIGAHVPMQTSKAWAFFFLFASIAFEIINLRSEVPLILKGAVTFSLALGYMGLILLTALSVARRLSLLETVALYAGLAASIFLELSSSATWKLTYVLFAYFLGRWIVRRHFGVATLLAGLAAIVFFTLVRGAMTEWRQLRWCTQQAGSCVSDTGAQWSERSLPAHSMLMLGLVQRQVDDSGFVGATRHSWSVVSQRATLDLLADAVRRTPNEVPYWDGETYRSLVGFTIPRFLWPDKPRKTLGQDFGHRYGYIADTDGTTSINLPFLVEFYLNFGEQGVIWGMCLVGVLFGLLDRYVNQPRQSLLVTLAAGVLLFPLLNIENDLSLQFGGLFLGAVALRIVMWTMEVLLPWRRRSSPWQATQPARTVYPRLTLLRRYVGRYTAKKLGGRRARDRKPMLAS
jgi:hypothetical protein